MEYNTNSKRLNIFPLSLLLLLLILPACNEKEEEKKLLVPAVASEFWDIGPEPDLSHAGLQPSFETDVQPNQPNDHCVFKADDGKWHLWACVRRTTVGRILCHWEADSLQQSPWNYTGDIIRASNEAGESLVEWKGQEFIQSPYVIKENDRYYMFYGGYDSGLDRMGNPTPPQPDYDSVEKQICLMTSPGGIEWERYENDSGYSRLFIGPGAARDINVEKFGDKYYAYYCGHHNMDRTCGAIYVRTSVDLYNWSDWIIAQYDKESEGKKWLPESPAVVYRDGYYYLFRTHGPKGGVYVYRSSDPMNFGHGDVSDYFVTRIPQMVACEIFTDDQGNEYITNITDGKEYGIRLARLNWIEEQE